MSTLTFNTSKPVWITVQHTEPGLWWRSLWVQRHVWTTVQHRVPGIWWTTQV